MNPDAILRGRAICVTGAGGFIGSHVVQALSAAGARIFAHLGPPAMVVPGLSAERLGAFEIEDLDALKTFARGADTIVHLAGPSSVAESFAFPDRHARAHALGAATVLLAMRAIGVRRLVHVSSAEVYGRQLTSPVSEDAVPAPRSPYAVAKLAAEGFVRVAAQQGEIDAIVLRPFSVYGPGLPARSLLASILAQASGSGPIRLARLEPVRDYVFVADVAEAIVRICGDQMPGPGTIFNVGSGVGVSVSGLAERVLAVVGRTAPVLGDLPSDRPTAADILTLVADVTSAQRFLGWRASTPLDVGIASTVAWLDRRTA